MLPLGLVLLPGVAALAGRPLGRPHRTGTAAAARRLRGAGAGSALRPARRGARAGQPVGLASRRRCRKHSPAGLLLRAGRGRPRRRQGAGALGAARRLLPQRPRAMVLGVAARSRRCSRPARCSAGAALAAHLREASGARAEASRPVPSARCCCSCWSSATCRTRSSGPSPSRLGPGFAFGAGTVVAPTGSALAQLPAFPMLAALPPGVHAAVPGWLEPTVLAVPYLAGALGGLLLVQVGTRLSLDAAPLWGLACGVVAAQRSGCSPRSPAARSAMAGWPRSGRQAGRSARVGAGDRRGCCGHCGRRRTTCRFATRDRCRLAQGGRQPMAGHGQCRRTTWPLAT